MVRDKRHLSDISQFEIWFSPFLFQLVNIAISTIKQRIS